MAQTALLRLLQISDSSFPSGAFAFSNGLETLHKENKKFDDDKINTAKFYFDKVLPRAEYHYKSAISGSSNIMNFKFN